MCYQCQSPQLPVLQLATKSFYLSLFPSVPAPCSTLCTTSHIETFNSSASTASPASAVSYREHVNCHYITTTDQTKHVNHQHPHSQSHRTCHYIITTHHTEHVNHQHPHSQSHRTCHYITTTDHTEHVNHQHPHSQPHRTSLECAAKKSIP